MASKRHETVISNASTFFQKRGYEVTTELLTLNDRPIIPDLMIRGKDGSKLPFECGTIQPGIPPLYLIHFNAYYHANKLGTIRKIPATGKPFIIGHVGCYGAQGYQRQKPAHQYLNPIKNFKSIRGTIGYHQYKGDFVKQVKIVRKAYLQKGVEEVFDIAFHNCKIISNWHEKQKLTAK